MDFENIAKSAKNAALEIADVSGDLKNKALLNIADALEKNKEKIFEANKKRFKRCRKTCGNRRAFKIYVQQAQTRPKQNARHDSRYTRHCKT